MKESQHKTNDGIISENNTDQTEQQSDTWQKLQECEQLSCGTECSSDEPTKGDNMPSDENNFESRVCDNAPQTDVKADSNTHCDGDSVAQRRAGASKSKPKALSYLIKLAILSAIGVVLLAIEFPLFPATPWLELNVSDFPTLIAAFMFGPLSGAIVNAVKIAISLFLWQTSTGFVGEMSNLISGTLYALVAGSIYILHRNKKGAIVALVISSAVFCLTMTLCNRYFLLPMYGMDAKPAVYGIMAWTVLFNVVKTVITSVVTFYVYKRTRQLFARF